MQLTAPTWVRPSFRETLGNRPAVLAIDTATDRATVALLRGDGACFEAPHGASRQHGRGLVGAIRDLMAEAGLKVSDLGAIGVGLGPGSFTGLRIGITAAKTLAYAVNCRLVGFDSLEAIALNAPDEAKSVVAVGDAQRGDLFVADFARSDGWVRVGATRLERVDTWPQGLEPGTWVVGPNLGRAEPVWADGVIRSDVCLGYARGETVLRLTLERIQAGQFVNAWFVEPSYVRRSAAEEKAWPIVEEAR